MNVEMVYQELLQEYRAAYKNRSKGEHFEDAAFKAVERVFGPDPWTVLMAEDHDRVLKVLAVFADMAVAAKEPPNSMRSRIAAFAVQTAQQGLGTDPPDAAVELLLHGTPLQQQYLEYATRLAPIWKAAESWAVNKPDGLLDIWPGEKKSKKGKGKKT